MTKTKRITWTVEKRKLADLKEHANNPRQFTEKGMKDLENSINSIGFMQPININQDGTILSGHARTKKLKEMGEVEVDVYVPDRVLTPKQEEEVLVRANANTAGQWDFDILANNFDLEEITDWGLDVPDMDLDIEEEAEVEEDEVPELKQKFAVKGDLFELIDEEQGLTHRVLCGDSTMIDDVEKVMNGEKADMVFTDPPYNTGMSQKTNNGSTWLNHMFNDSFTDEEWDKLLIDFTNNYYLSSKEDSVSYICLDWRRSHELVPNAKNAGFKFSNLIIWDKMVHGLGSDYKYTHEFIHVFKKGKPALNTNQGEQDYQDIWHIQRKIGRDEEHATKKPIELCTRAIKHASKQKDLVIDFFLGSGSTLIACQQTKRNCYGIELDEHYCGVIVKRWLNYMQKENKTFKIKRNDEDFDVKKIDKGGEFAS